MVESLWAAERGDQVNMADPETSGTLFSVPPISGKDEKGSKTWGPIDKRYRVQPLEISIYCGNHAFSLCFF